MLESTDRVVILFLYGQETTEEVKVEETSVEAAAEETPAAEEEVRMLGRH